MNEDFVPFELAKKLKEKGFNCEYPFAMYTKYEQFCPLYSSDKYYFGIDDFDKHACIAPTISQVLKWLRETKRIDAGAVWDNRDGKWVGYINEMDMSDLVGEYVLPNTYDAYEAAAIAGIEYIIDNLM